MRVGGIQGEVDLVRLQAKVEELSILPNIVVALLARVKALEGALPPIIPVSSTLSRPTSTLSHPFVPETTDH